MPLLALFDGVAAANWPKVLLLLPLLPPPFPMALPLLWKAVLSMALYDGVSAVTAANWPKVLLLLPPLNPMALPLLRKAVLSLALYDGVAPDVADGVAAVAAVAIGCAGSRFRCRSAEDVAACRRCKRWLCRCCGRMWGF